MVWRPFLPRVAVTLRGEAPGRWVPPRSMAMVPVLAALSLAVVVPTVAHAQASDTEGYAVYVVRRGDTLASLALAGTGDALRFKELIRYNEATLGDPVKLDVGMSLRVPPGWNLPGAAVPEGEQARTSPLPASTSQRPGLDDLGGGGPTVSRGAVTAAPAPRQGTVEADTLLVVGNKPVGFNWERFTFFPALSVLDEDFHQLMLRAAYAGDVAWGAAQMASSREEQLDLFEQQILVAEEEFARVKAKYDECKLSASRAERLLNRFERPDDEMARLEDDAIGGLAEAWEAERALWEDMLWPDLTNSARDAWEAFVASLGLQSYNTEDWSRAYTLHEQLDPYRAALSGWEFTPAEREAFSGEKVKAALERIISLATDDRYRAISTEREKYQEALLSVQQVKSCEREFVNAEAFLKQQRQKRIRLESLVSQGSGDALEVDARRIAERYSGVLGEVQLVNAYLSNRQWAELWWKAGVALRLAKEHELGAKRIAQAAAVADDHRLPSGAIPGHLEGWLREAENDTLRTQPGYVEAHLPVGARLTVDGRDIKVNFGEAEISLAPGVHRFVMWIEESEPLMRLVGVLEGETTVFNWYEQPRLSGEDEGLIGERPVLPILPEEPKPKRWWTGVTAQAGLTLGRPTFGPDLTVRYQHDLFGGQLGLAGLAPTKAYWVNLDDEMPFVVRFHGAATVGGRFGKAGLLGLVGLYGDPYLGMGPQTGLEFSWDVKPKVRIAVEGKVGYDVMKHFDGIPRVQAAGGFGVWF